MQESVMCWHCQKQSSVTPSTQTVRCHGCKRIISIGKNQETISRGTNRQSSREEGKMINNTKHLHNPFKKWPCKTSANTASPSTNGNNSLSDSISTWEATPGKRALLCGVTYHKQKFELRGTTYDVNSMRDLLVGKFDFPSSSIHILTEEAHCHPTKKNIQAALQWLVKDCKPGDSLLFYFSGHGLRQPDFIDDETDGFDETICPLDFKTEGMIIDNEINDTIVRPLKKGVTLHAIIDACHSGTVLDLTHVYSTKAENWVDNLPPSGVNKGTRGGRAICFSACKDDQLAADTDVFLGKKMAGAMTYTFKKAVEENPKITYGGILASIHKDIKEKRETRWLKLRGIFHPKLLQEPLLSSSEEFDINTEFNL